MPRPCTICAHLRRDEIDRAVVAGQTLQATAQAFAVSVQALGRHTRDHLRRRIAAVSAVDPAIPFPTVEPIIEEPIAAFFRARCMAELGEAASLRDHALRDLDRLEALLAAAVAANDGGAILATLRTKWFVAERAGLTANTGQPLRGGQAGPYAPALAAMASQLLQRLQRERCGSSPCIPGPDTSTREPVQPREHSDDA